MKAASDFVYIKKSIKLSLSNETEEIKEEQWEIESDELNQNFDSDAPDNEAQEESKGKFILNKKLIFSAKRKENIWI